MDISKGRVVFYLISGGSYNVRKHTLVLVCRPVFSW
jgi:hypothetical protein